MTMMITLGMIMAGTMAMIMVTTTLRSDGGGQDRQDLVATRPRGRIRCTESS